MYKNELTEIIPGLFLSDWKSAEDYQLLMKHKIKAIITIETRFKNQSVLDFYRMHNIDWMYIYAGDSPTDPLSRYFDVTANFIQDHLNKGENVLVHCWAGVSRSATIVLNYMIRDFIQTNGKNDKTYAFPLVQYMLKLARKKRPIVNPNVGFVNQLYIKTVEYLFKILN